MATGIKASWALRVYLLVSINSWIQIFAILHQIGLTCIEQIIELNMIQLQLMKYQTLSMTIVRTFVEADHYLNTL